MTVLIRSTIDMQPDWSDISKRGHSRIMKAVYFDIGDHWQRNMLPDHFRSGAAAKYGYAPRKAGYQRSKFFAFKKGKARRPNVDLVFTGDLRTIVARPHVVRAFATRATINIPGPSYLRSKPKPGSNRPDMAAEITAVAPDEFGELDRVGERRLEQQLRDYPVRKRTKT